MNSERGFWLAVAFASLVPVSCVGYMILAVVKSRRFWKRLRAKHAERAMVSPHIRGCKRRTALECPVGWPCFCPDPVLVCDVCDPCTCGAASAHE